MFNRRKFLSNSILATLGLTLTNCDNSSNDEVVTSSTPNENIVPVPTVISTWKFGLEANEVAWDLIQKGERALDAVEKGLNVTEADKKNTTVGIGGAPDRDGTVTLDACIMDEFGNAGSVCAIQDIKHPVSVARKVMEDTPHVILVGQGATDFAVSKGFEKENLLTEKSKKAWEKWKVEQKVNFPHIDENNHDTIGLLAIDKKGNLSGGCTTSGWAYKLPGRVGDSPIIGAGLFVDNEVGAATATGMGEVVLKSLGTFLVVELMRQGRTPQEACEEAVGRSIKQYENDLENVQVGYIAINKKGEHGAYAIKQGFVYSLYQNGENKVYKAGYAIAVDKLTEE